MLIEVNQSSLSLFLNQEPTSNFVEMLVFKVHWSVHLVLTNNLLTHTSTGPII